VFDLDAVNRLGVKPLNTWGIQIQIGNWFSLHKHIEHCIPYGSTQLLDFSLANSPPMGRLEKIGVDKSPSVQNSGCHGWRLISGRICVFRE
jgi:hypothetical protein